MKTITPPASATAGDLRPAVAALAKVVKKNAPDPALHCAKVAPVGRDSFRLTGADPATFFTVQIRGESPAKFEPFLGPVDRLKDLVRGAKADERVALRPVRNAPPASVFPATPKFRAAPVELGEEAITAVLRAFACASTDETRQILQGACFDVGAKGGCRIVGTDGRHLFASGPLDIPGLNDPVILPSLKVLGSPLVKGSPTWDLRVAGSANGSGGRLFRLTGDNWDLTGHLHDGNYPKYQQVIPSDREFKTRVALPGEILGALIRALGRMSGRRMQNRPVGLRIGKGKVGILAREDGKSPYEELLIPAKVEGKPTTVFVNRDYLAKALSFGLSQIAMADAISPVRFTGEGGMMIVMPVRQQGEIEVCRSEPLGGSPTLRPRRSQSQRPKPAPAVTKKKPKQKGKTVPPPPRQPARGTNGNGSHPPDPEGDPAVHIAAAKDALRSAMSTLNATSAALKGRPEAPAPDREGGALRTLHVEVVE